MRVRLRVLRSPLSHETVTLSLVIASSTPVARRDGMMLSV